MHRSERSIRYEITIDSERLSRDLEYARLIHMLKWRQNASFYAGRIVNETESETVQLNIFRNLQIYEKTMGEYIKLDGSFKKDVKENHEIRVLSRELMEELQERCRNEIANDFHPDAQRVVADLFDTYSAAFHNFAMFQNSDYLEVPILVESIGLPEVEI